MDTSEQRIDTELHTYIINSTFWMCTLWNERSKSWPHNSIHRWSR